MGSPSYSPTTPQGPCSPVYSPSSPRWIPTTIQGSNSPVYSPSSPWLAPTTTQGRMIKISRKEMIDEIDEVQYERGEILSLEVEVASYSKDIASYSGLLQDAMAIYLQATIFMDSIIALTVIEPRLPDLYMRLVSEQDRQSVLRTMLSCLSDQVSKFQDKIPLVKGMADEYIAAIKARLPCETDTLDLDVPIIDLPFWSGLDRLWHLCVDVRKEIDDYKKKANDVQHAILTIHLSLAQLLRKLEMEREVMGNDVGFLNAHAQDRDYNVALLDVVQNLAPLHFVEWLLKAGANPNTQHLEYGHVLRIAVGYSDLEIIQLLLSFGADTNAQDDRNGSVLQAAVSQHVMPFRASYTKRDIVLVILDAGANVNSHHAAHRSALFQAVTIHDWDIVTLLIDAGADVNERNFDNESALYRAITTFLYNGIIVERLLDAGADVNVKGGEYGFPLQAAAFQGCEEIVKLLVEKGAKVNAQGGKYGTALQAAASIGEIAIVKYLLDKGANVNVQSGLFGSPLEAALANCARDGLGITNHLLNAGAR